MNNKTIIYVILMFLLVSNANAEKYFVLDVNHMLGSVTFNSVNLREIDRTVKYTDKSGFLVKTVSFNNLDIEKIYYNMSENKNYLIYIPYNENAVRIDMYNQKNSKIMELDASSFSNTCGNKACEGHESYESCAKDCNSGSRDDFCDGISDNICDPDCSPKTDADCEILGPQETNESAVTKTKQEKPPIKEPKEKSGYLIWILLALISIALILLFLFIKKRRENQIISSLREYISENIRRGFTLQQIRDVLYREGYSEKEINKAVRSI